MQDSIRKHILSEYAISVIPYNGYTPRDSYQDQSILNVSDPTVLTENIENSDPDEMRMGPTNTTFTVETTDDDEFLLM